MRILALLLVLLANRPLMMMTSAAESKRAEIDPEIAKFILEMTSSVTPSTNSLCDVLRALEEFAASNRTMAGEAEAARRIVENAAAVKNKRNESKLECPTMKKSISAGGKMSKNRTEVNPAKVETSETASLCDDCQMDAAKTETFYKNNFGRGNNVKTAAGSKLLNALILFGTLIVAGICVLSAVLTLSVKALCKKCGKSGRVDIETAENEANNANDRQYQEHQF